VTKAASRYRSQGFGREAVVGFSVSFEHDDMLARGLGIEHLRDLLRRLARPILRQGASLAYGGHWQETEENFTFDLLRLISAEQEDNSLGGPDSSVPIGILYNHVPWPNYLQITPAIEAQWVTCCRIVRVTQLQGGVPPDRIVPDEAANPDEPRSSLNAALTASAMRRIQMEGQTISVADVPRPERIPAISARIVLGGNMTTYRSFVPGIFEEALVTLEVARPLYLLGGFGGAAGLLAEAILAPPGQATPALTVEWLIEKNARLAALIKAANTVGIGPEQGRTEDLLARLRGFVEQARVDPAGMLRTGLDADETREMLQTHDIAGALRLVRKGLGAANNLSRLPA